MMNACLSTVSAEHEKLENVYNDIGRTMTDCDSTGKVITGDFNDLIGTKTKED